MKLLRVVLSGEEHPYYTITKAFQKRFDVDTIYWDEFSNIGSLNEVIRARVKAIKYDAVFMQIQRAGVIEIETARVLYQNALVFNWTGDVRENIDWYRQLAPYCVTLFTSMTDVQRMIGYGYRANYLQTGYDTAYYYNKGAKRQDQIAFCANYYKGFPMSEFRYLAAGMMWRMIPANLVMYGNGWHEVRIPTLGNADNVTESCLYNESSLALSISNFNYSRYFSDRLLREMACGCCVISHRFKSLELEFVENKHLVCFESLEEMMELTKYYLAHPKEARVIGDEAAKFVAENYTWNNFVEKFEKLIHQYK